MICNFINLLTSIIRDIILDRGRGGIKHELLDKIKC